MSIATETLCISGYISPLYIQQEAEGKLQQERTKPLLLFTEGESRDSAYVLAHVQEIKDNKGAGANSKCKKELNLTSTNYL